MGIPDFFILGAQRAGTSSLTLCLIKHPRIAPATAKHKVFGKTEEGVHVISGGPERTYIGKYTGPKEFPMPWSVGSFMKETSYFSRFYKLMDLRDYRSFFDNNGNGMLAFDGSPEYLDMVGVETRVRRDCPNARFIVLLRNPVDRIWSHYWHEVKSNLSEALPFEEAINRTMSCYCSEYFFGYLRRGHYAEHLLRWFEKFPRDRFKVYIMEEFFSDTENYKGLQKWLGLNPIVELESYEHHTTLEDGYPEMPEETRMYLERYYSGRNQELRELLGRELPW